MADENKKAVEEADTSKTTKSEKKEKKSKKAKKHFFKDLKGETKKIVWPGRKMVIKSTGVVLLAILVIGAGIWIIDYALSGAIKAFNEAADAEPTTQVETTVPTTAATTAATTEVVLTTDAVSTEAESTTNA